MRDVRECEVATWFPEYGARARGWRRFEGALRAWLETPEGRFATWRAQAALSGARGEDRRG